MNYRFEGAAVVLLGLIAAPAIAQTAVRDGAPRGLVDHSSSGVAASQRPPQDATQTTGLSADQCARLLDRAARDPALASLAASCTPGIRTIAEAGVHSHDLPGKARAPSNVRARDMAFKLKSVAPAAPATAPK